MSFEALSGLSLDQLEDLPGFEVFPAGTYRCILSFAAKEINKNPAVEISLTCGEVLELADSSKTPPKEGDKCNSAFMLHNEYGRGNLKRILAPLAEHFGSTDIPELLEAAEGTEAVVTTKVRKNKETDAEYLDIRKIIIE